MLNLIKDACFPVIRQNGQTDRIAIWQICETHNPIINFQVSRPDFAGALYEFAIGLLQTCFAPDEDAWETYFHEPPKPEELKAALLPFADAFELFPENGSRFMQDMDLDPSPKEAKSIAGLLIEAPGGNTLVNNTDHFNKRESYADFKVSPFYTAISLYNLNAYAPSGGVGHRTGLRGGGPLTTLIKRPQLWQTLWLGVLTKDQFLGDAAAQWRNPSAQDLFPWLRPCLTSTGGEVVPVESSHPATLYWAQPRRIQLLEPIHESGVCDISGEKGDVFFTHYVTKNYGNNYGTGWLHPLTPHYENKDKDLLPIHGQPGRIGYQHYLGLVMSSGDLTKTRRLPARIISAFTTKRRYEVNSDGGADFNPTFWTFGYDMDNMKARQWIDQTMPLVLAEDPAQSEDYQVAVAGMILAAQHAAAILRKNVRNAMIREKVTVSGDLSYIDEQFWIKTQPKFLARAREFSLDPQAVEPAERWLKDLYTECLKLYDQLTMARPVHQSYPQRWADCRRNLIRFTSFKGKKMRGFLHLDKYVEDPERSEP